MFYQHRHFRPFSNFKVCVNENCVKCLLKFALNLAVFCCSLADLTFLSASAVLLVWFNKKCSCEIRVEDLKKQAKEMGLSLLCNKDKNTFIKALASALIKEKKVDSVWLYKSHTRWCQNCPRQFMMKFCLFYHWWTCNTWKKYRCMFEIYFSLCCLLFGVLIYYPPPQKPKSLLRLKEAELQFGHYIHSFYSFTMGQ